MDLGLASPPKKILISGLPKLQIFPGTKKLPKHTVYPMFFLDTLAIPSHVGGCGSDAVLFAKLGGVLRFAVLKCGSDAVLFAKLGGVLRFAVLKCGSDAVLFAQLGGVLRFFLQSSWQ